MRHPRKCSDPSGYAANVEFSPIGALVSLAVLAPNLLLIRFPPKPPLPKVPTPWLLVWLERAGQALCLVVPAITEPGWFAWPWAFPAIGCLAAYLGLWARYLVRGRQRSLLFHGPGRLVIPMAVLPVLAFACTAAWLGNPWIAASAAVLAAGHIPVSARLAAHT